MNLPKAAVLILMLVLTAMNLGVLALNLAVRARAEVAGMDWFQLAKDDDFRKAVAQVVGSSCIIDSDRPAGLAPKILC